MCMYALSHDSRVRLFATLACEALLSMRFSRQEYWNGLPCPPPGDLPHQGLEPVFPAASCMAGRFFAAEYVCILRDMCN